MMNRALGISDKNWAKMSEEEKDKARKSFAEKHSKDSETIHKNSVPEDALTAHRENNEVEKDADPDENGNQENIGVKSG